MKVFCWYLLVNVGEHLETTSHMHTEHGHWNTLKLTLAAKNGAFPKTIITTVFEWQGLDSLSLAFQGSSPTVPD